MKCERHILKRCLGKRLELSNTYISCSRLKYSRAMGLWTHYFPKSYQLFSQPRTSGIVLMNHRIIFLQHFALLEWCIIWLRRHGSQVSMYLPFQIPWLLMQPSFMAFLDLVTSQYFELRSRMDRVTLHHNDKLRTPHRIYDIRKTLSDIKHMCKFNALLQWINSFRCSGMVC